MANPERPPMKLYDDEGDLLLSAESFPDKVTLLPSGPIGSGVGPGAVERVRVLWGQDMLRDILDGRYRAVVCAVNDTDNSHGIIAQLVDLIRPASGPRA